MALKKRGWIRKTENNYTVFGATQAGAAAAAASESVCVCPNIKYRFHVCNDIVVWPKQRFHNRLHAYRAFDLKVKAQKVSEPSFR